MRMVTGVAVLMLGSSPLAAQYSWGPELGLNVTTYGGLDAQSAGAQPRIGLHAGVGAMRQLKRNRLFVETRILYSQRGANFRVSPYSGAMRFGYVEIPARLGWAFPRAESRWAPHVEAGAHVGLKAGCTLKSAGSSSPCADKRGVDFGVGGGTGVSLKGVWQFSLSYLMGLRTTDQSQTGTSADLKNRGLTLRAARFVRVGKR